MRHTLCWIAMSAALAAQDLTPNLARAAAETAREAARELPWKAPAAKSLRVAAADRNSTKAAEAVALRLADAGFRGDADGAADLTLTVAVKREKGARTLETTADGPVSFSYAVRYADAEWVDDPALRDRVVMGGEARTEAEALGAVRAAARDRLAAKYPRFAATKRGRRALSAEPDATFVARTGDGAETRFRAYALCPADGRDWARDEAAAARAATRAPWIKSGLTAAAGLVFFALYKGADWITRGWRSRALGALFGSLFAAAAFGFWRMPS
jgi:hypothetical protein